MFLLSLDVAEYHPLRRARRMSEQKSLRRLFCEVNRSGGMAQRILADLTGLNGFFP